MKNSKSINLSLDISSVCTGYAVFEDKDLISFGKIEPKGNTVSEKLHEFYRTVYNLCSKYEPDSIAIEALYRGPNAKTFKTLSMFHGIVFLVCQEKLSKEPIAYEVKKARRLAGLYFNTKFLDKKSVFEFMKNHYELDCSFAKGNDIADAIAIGIAHLKAGE